MRKQGERSCVIFASDSAHMLHDVVPALYDEQKAALSITQPASLLSDPHWIKAFPKLSGEWARDTNTSITYLFMLFFAINIHLLTVFC